MLLNRNRLGAFAWLMTGVVGTTVEPGESPPLVAYSNNGTAAASFRIWDGATWGSASTTTALADDAKWINVIACPNRTETALAGLGAAKDLYLMFYDGTSWGAANVLTTDTEFHDQRCFSIAYEQDSGDLLVAYYEKDALALCYRTWGGTSLSAELTLALPAATKLRWVSLYPKKGSDEIFMMSVNDGNDVYAAVWSGTAWSAVDTFETDTGFDLYECYSLAFEGLSGEALAVYAQKDQTQPRYRTYTGGAWSAEANLPSVGVKQRWERLAGDPATDTILFGSLDDGADININVWNGSSWGTNVEMTTAAQTADKRQFDIAFPQNGGTGLVVYVEKDKKTPRYRTWDGSAWSAELTAADLGDKLRVVSLTPGREDGEIFVLVSDDGTDLNFLHWNGTAMSTNTQLEASLGGGSDLTRQFMVVVPTPFWRITSWQEVEP